MPIPQAITQLIYPAHIQVLDHDFDASEMDDELKSDIQIAETELFYHDGFGLEQ